MSHIGFRKDKTQFENESWNFRNYFFNNKRGVMGAAEKFTK